MHRRRSFLALALAIAWLAGCGGSPTQPPPVIPPPVVEPPPEEPPPPPPPTPVLGITRILAFGDSLTYGTLSPPLPGLSLDAGIPESYPFKLQRTLTDRYATQTITVLNDGFPGRRATDDRGRFSGSVRDVKPDLVLLMHGANDLLALAGRTPLQIDNGTTNTVNAVEDMVRDATGRGIKVMLATLPPQRLASPPGVTPRGGAAPLVADYNAALKSMAAKKGATIVDVSAQLPLSMIGADGLHLTEAGNQKLAEIFFDAIRAAHEVSGSPASGPAPHR